MISEQYYLVEQLDTKPFAHRAATAFDEGQNAAAVAPPVLTMKLP